MKRSWTAAVVMMMVFSFGCVTTQQSATNTALSVNGQDCAGSVYAKLGPTQVDQALTLMVAGLQMYSYYDAARYAEIQSAAKVAVSLLRNKAVGATLSSLGYLGDTNKGAEAFITVLTTLYPPNQLLSPCDREVLARYLEMI